uniref:Uncharacterized protein n=1 Tax=Rhizophora mucronata TaxID=61149 RepID=A0A2P2P3B1_RHIMU
MVVGGEVVGMVEADLVVDVEVEVVAEDAEHLTNPV